MVSLFSADHCEVGYPKFCHYDHMHTMSKENADNNSHHSNDPILSHLLKQLRPFQREAYDFCTMGIVSNRQVSSADSENNSGSTPIVYQRDLLGKGRILLADEMGLGKSITSLAIMAHYRSTDWPLLILCPASLRHTWPSEIEKFVPSLPPSSIYVVSGFDDADFYENEAKRKKIQIVVATYSLLQTRSAAAKTLAQFKFQAIIADESHNLKQKNSQRTKITLPLLQQAKRLVLLTGTPALARPVELWTQISAIAPGLFEKNYTQFTKHYCNARYARFGWDVSGLSNAGELHSKLKQIMVRRLKNDVLHELPPKQRTIASINIPNGDRRRECESILKDLAETRQSIHELVGEAADGANFEARTLLMKAYQASGVAKSPGVCDYLLEWLRGSGSQKVLVFGHHKGVLDAIEVAVAKEFKGTGHIRIDGTVNSQERAARVRKFQTSSRIRVAILSITAAGVGLTLTAATTVIFGK
jgi:SWI/SNF-related matrix-associated actin-dependent regulator 1 of chromatin subfamily A